MRYEQYTRFRTTVDFDREYLSNESSNREAKKYGVSSYDLLTLDENNWANFGALTKKGLDL